MIIIVHMNIMTTSVSAKPYLLLHKHPPKATASIMLLDMPMISPLCAG